MGRAPNGLIEWKRVHAQICLLDWERAQAQREVL